MRAEGSDRVAMGRWSGSRSPVAVGLVAIVLLAAAGCGEREAREPRQPIAPGPGYAYTAVLMAAHPLYGALARLELASARLGDDEMGLAGGLMGSEFETVTLTETLAYGPNLDSLLQRQGWWAEQYRRHHGLVEELPRDLWARLEWEREDAQRQVERRMREAGAELTRELARLRARLVREQQERLNNLGLDLAGRESDVLRAAEEEQARIWAVIERQVELAREAGERDLSELRRELEDQADARVARAREQAEETARERREQMAMAGEELHDEMGAEMDAVVVADLPAQEMSYDPSPANRQLAAGERSWAEAGAAREEVVDRQRRRLLAAQARLRVALKEDTELWALAVARRHDVQLQLLPGGSRVGNDITSSIAGELSRVWRSGLD